MVEKRMTYCEVARKLCEFKSILGQTKTGYVVIDHQHEIIEASESYVVMHGYQSEAEMLGIKTWQHNASLSRDEVITRFTRLEEMSFDVDVQHYKKDGSLIDLELHAKGGIINGVPAVVVLANDITKRKKAERELQAYITRLKEQNCCDPLTGVYNRYYLEEEVKRLKRSNDYPITFISLDIDGLKSVNDAFGHNAGDHLIKDFVEIVKASIRYEDKIIRLGGDEFLVVLPSADAKEGLLVRKRIDEMMASYNTNPDNHMVVSASSGCATMMEAGEDMESYINEADQAMYNNKKIRKGMIRSR